MKSVLGFLVMYIGWVVSTNMTSSMMRLAFLLISISGLWFMSPKIRAVVLRLSLGSLFLIFGLDKLSNLEQFAESIDAYQLIPSSMTLPMAYVLVPVEVIAGGVFVAISLGEVAGRRNVMGSSVTSAMHVALAGMLGTFCIAITYGLFTNPGMDCGCGDAWNPIDVFAKSLWSCFTGERIPGLGASLFRNLLSLTLLWLSFNWYKRDVLAMTES